MGQVFPYGPVEKFWQTTNGPQTGFWETLTSIVSFISAFCDVEQKIGEENKEKPSVKSELSCEQTAKASAVAQKSLSVLKHLNFHFKAKPKTKKLLLLLMIRKS